MKGNIIYDREFDTLFISKKGMKAKFSLEVLDSFILDIGHNGTVVGIEILGASKTLDVSKKQLENIRKANIRTIIKDKGIVVFFQIEFIKLKIESRIAVPVAARTLRR